LSIAGASMHRAENSSKATRKQRTKANQPVRFNRSAWIWWEHVARDLNEILLVFAAFLANLYDV
jgi:hypothetical protein